MNMKQSCKALICAIEGELDGRHCTEEQATAILDHALPSLTEALALAEAERDRYKAAWMEFMDRTDWMQEKGQVPAKYLGQHRADALTAMLNEARAALATQPAAGEPVAWIVVEEPFHGVQGIQSGEWDIELDAKAIEILAQDNSPGRIALFTAAPPAAAQGDMSMAFEYVGPNKERRTVVVHRDEIAEHMEEQLFQKLTVAVCMCDLDDSDDCRCDEAAEQFTLRAQAGEGGE